jgi:pyrroloquinoline quinone biosynthesis protein B
MALATTFTMEPAPSDPGRAVPDPRTGSGRPWVEGPYTLVLGIAQDAGYPQAGCRGACCAPAWADPSRRRHAACLALVDPGAGRRWLIDATPDLRQQLRALDLACPPALDEAAPALEGIFLTHGHLGHVLGLLQLGKEAMGARGVPVYAMPRLLAFLRQHEPWAALERGRHVIPQPLAAHETLLLPGGLTVEPVPVPHRDELTETVAFRIGGPARRLLYLPDIDGWPQAEAMGLSLPSLLATVDRAYVDATFFDGTELPGRDIDLVPHPPAADTLARAAILPPGERAKLRLTHLNHTNPLLQPGAPQRTAVLASGVGLAEEGERWGL